MPRGGHKVVKPVKAPQPEPQAPARSFTATSIGIAKPTRTNTDWKAGLIAPSFLARTSSETKLANPSRDLPPVQESSLQTTPKLDVSIGPLDINTELASKEVQDHSAQPIPSRTPSVRSIREDETCEATLDTFEDLTTVDFQSIASSSIYSRDSTSIYSRSSSIYSGASSIYSGVSSIYSTEDGALDDLDRFSRKGSTDFVTKETDATHDPRSQVQQRARPTTTVRRQEPQDAAARERSTLAKKAALFKNSRLAPQLPSFSTSLPTWSMICRAARASQDCYDSQILTRRGTYTAADPSKDIKAMIVDDQLLDESKLIIVAIRGTDSQSLTDWTVNTTANPVKPVGFLDDIENGCHAGFLQVTKAMVGQVATQLKKHPASSEKPSLVFTGHSAGGAVAAMLYSHMLSTSVNSDLTALASQYPNISCVTFGAPPLSQMPLPKRDHGSGVFLSFANEGDLVLRTSNAAYFKSLAKLMTASPPPSTAPAIVAPPPKVVRGSRGATVYRQALPVAPPTPWEELPLWPTPAPSMTNGGDIILLRDNENGNGVASKITSEDLREVIFGDLAQHTCDMYIRRVKDAALTAMMGGRL